jgi:predicted PurR-regulated permease PerM
MQDLVRLARTWATFAGVVLVVAVLYWAREVLAPIALAVLLTFLLAPIVAPLQRVIGRVPAVLTVVTLTFGVLAVVGWATTRQLSLVVQELPAYRQNIREKIRDVRAAGTESVGGLQQAIEDIRREIEPAPPAGSPAQSLVVRDDRTTGPWRFPALGGLLEPLATAGLVVVLVVFMLLERQDLRDRLIRMFGHGRLTATTRAFDEAGRRVSRYLLTQSVVNVTYGAGVGLGLWALGVPYPVLWGFLGAALRFIPYVGPWIAAVAPVLVALAVLEGWTRPLLVAGLFVVLELFTNLVLETVFYAGAAGFSQVGLLVAVAFWTWLWGPLGLLIATPLTVCLLVLGKHIGLDVLTTLISDEPVLEPDVRFYQRLLAGDQAEAAEVMEEQMKAEPSAAVYDGLVLPALTYAERDRLEGRLTPEEERGLVAAAAELLEEAAAPPPPDTAAPTAGAVRLRILGCPARGDADALALRLLDRLLAGSPVELDAIGRPLSAFELTRLVRDRGYDGVCIVDLPPEPPSRARLLAKRLRAAFPELKLLIGRWAPEAYRDETAEPLRAAGADHVGTTLQETAESLVRLATAGPADGAAARRGAQA